MWFGQKTIALYLCNHNKMNHIMSGILSSSIGRKFAMAISALFLMIFLLQHFAYRVTYNHSKYLLKYFLWFGQKTIALYLCIHNKMNHIMSGILSSSIGRKFAMAISALFLMIFLLTTLCYQYSFCI